MQEAVTSNRFCAGMLMKNKQKESYYRKKAMQTHNLPKICYNIYFYFWKLVDSTHLFLFFSLFRQDKRFSIQSIAVINCLTTGEKEENRINCFAAVRIG